MFGCGNGGRANVSMFEWMGKVSKQIKVMNVLQAIVFVFHDLTLSLSIWHHQWIYTKNLKRDVYKIKWNLMSVLYSRWDILFPLMLWVCAMDE